MSNSQPSRKPENIVTIVQILKVSLFIISYLESDNDDPVRNMLKSSILQLYDDNKTQLFNNAKQYKELKQIQEQREQYFKLGWKYDQMNQFQNPIFNVGFYYKSL